MFPALCQLRRKKMKIRTILMSSCGLILSPNVWAQTPGQCAIAPTCSELGYEQQASDCTGQHMLKCPFDTSKVFCGGEACNYTNTSLPSGCSTADSCIKDGKNYYSSICSSCYTGYSLKSNGTCSQTCTYTNTSTAHCSDYDSCKLGSASGSKTYYYCNSCDAGYSLSNGSCVSSCNKSCSGGYYLDYSTCSCKCGLSGSDCGSGYYLSGCSCQSCSNQFSNSLYAGVRTSSPYTSSECDSYYINEPGFVRGFCPSSSSCGGTTYYYCYACSGD